MINKNVTDRNRKIREIVAEHYEPGRQDRCKLWVYRKVVVKIYPISERTFWRSLKQKSKEKNQ
jgi:hypothetical protein